MNVCNVCGKVQAPDEMFATENWCGCRVPPAVSDYEYGRMVLRMDQLLRAFREASIQSRPEADIAHNYTVELGNLARRLWSERK